jgi:1,4-dihydroxy-2-naphthoate octaprenyltransferase/chlorophyll synthase
VKADTLARRWLYALKPASWPKLLVPMALGQTLGVIGAGSFSLAGAVFGAAFTLLELAFIVLLNDWADRKVDAIKRRMFPQACSPKTIPDAVLPAEHVLTGGLIAGLLAVAVAFAGAWALSRPLLGFAGLACLAIFVAYSLPPLAVNYRGGGELLEAAGIGAALPWFNAYAQSGRLAPDAASVLLGFSALALASAVASGLSDEQSDRAGGKSTVVTQIGNRRARRVVEVAVLCGALLWLAAAFASSRLAVAVTLPATSLVLWQYFRVRAQSPAATTNAFAAQRLYKHDLHRALWWGASVLSVGLLIARFVLV